jgi:hypothetical protein
LVLGTIESQKKSKLGARQYDMSASMPITMKMKSAAVSEHHARLLLSAWNSGDLRRLQDTLTHSSISVEPTGFTGEDERERLEMLATIADAMRNWLRRGGDAPTEDLQVSVKLLRHLAGIESLWRESRGLGRGN